jgi:single-strand DNA-binding protein
MATSLNKVSLIGHAGKDPEIRTIPTTGKEVASFSLATSESWSDKMSGELKTKTEWHNIVVFNEHLVKLVKRSVVKGSKLYVEGNLNYRKWQDKAGVNHTTAEVVLQIFGASMVILDKKSGEHHADDQGGSDSGRMPAMAEDHFEPDDMPF